MTGEPLTPTPYPDYLVPHPETLLPFPEAPGVVQTILDEAKAAVYGPRAATYGHPRENFAAIASMWNGWLEAHFPAEGPQFHFGVEDVADLMILTKMARLISSPAHRDSLVDIAGYAEARARASGVDA